MTEFGDLTIPDLPPPPPIFKVSGVTLVAYIFLLKSITKIFVRTAKSVRHFLIVSNDSNVISMT